MVQRSRAQRLNGLFPLSYTGVVPVSPVNFVMDNRAPTVNDSKNFYLGDMWLDISTQPPTTRNLWVLTSLVGNLATWDNFGSGDLETLTGNSGGPVFPLGNNINVVGDGTTINVVGNPATNTLTISAVGAGTTETLTGNSGGAVSPLAGNINTVGDGTTITIIGNPGTHTLTASTVGTGVVSSMTGNSGGAVFPIGGNTNVVGTGVITVVGNPGTHTLTVTPSDSIASSFITNPATGTAVPVAGALTFAGAGGIAISASGHTVTITASGTPAAQCAFLANKTATSAAVTGDGTLYTVIFDHVFFDLSSNYNPATGTFTAPTTGTYSFIFCCSFTNVSQSVKNDVDMILVVNGGPQQYLQNNQGVTGDAASNVFQGTTSFFIELNAGDTVQCIAVDIIASAPAKTTGVMGNNASNNDPRTTFAGYRLDPAASFITGTETFHTDDGNDVTPDITGLVNVSGANNINTTGTVGPNTITIHYVPTSSFTADFNTETNITGDGTIAQLGKTAAATVLTNVGSNFNPGNGAGTAASYTVPVTGLYFFYMYTDFSVGASATAGVDFSMGLSGSAGFNFSKGPTSNSVVGYENNSGEINVGGSCVLQLTATNVINFVVQSNGNAKNVTINTGTVGGYRIS
jgi:C1q domain